MKFFKDVWENALSIIEKDVPEIPFNTWIKCITPEKLSEGTAILSVMSDFQRDIIISKYHDLIKRSLSQVFGFEINVSIIVSSNIQNTSNANTDESINDTYEEIMRKLDENDNEYSFENFVIGNSNKFAAAACMSITANPGLSYNPLFIYGHSGLGKTHLLYAIMTDIRKNFPDYRILYLKGDEFANELISSISSRTQAAFKNKYRNVDVLLMDDIQFISNMDSTQTEFYHTFNSLFSEKKQIVIASDCSPRDLVGIEERIISRFEGGITADVQAPDFETRSAIVRKKAKMLDLNLSEDVITLLATKIKNNIRQLEGTVKKMKAFHSLSGEIPNHELAMRVITETIRESAPVVSVDRIIIEVGKYYKIDPIDIKGVRRNADIALARQIAIYIVKKMTDLSQNKIGAYFSGKDNSTVIHSIKKIEETIVRDPGLRTAINDIIKNLKE